jgi:hypothetical protein
MASPPVTISMPLTRTPGTTAKGSPAQAAKTNDATIPTDVRQSQMSIGLAPGHYVTVNYGSCSTTGGGFNSGYDLSNVVTLP